MPPLTITLLEPGVTLQTLGAVPDMLDANDPAPAREQLDRGYRDGGGFRALSGWYLGADDVLHFPGDRPYRPIAEMRMRAERILIFEGSFVADIAPDRSFEVARMDLTDDPICNRAPRAPDRQPREGGQRNDGGRSLFALHVRR